MSSWRRRLVLSVIMAMIASTLFTPTALAVDEERDGPFTVRSTFTGNYEVAYAEMGLYPNIEGGELSVTVPASSTGVVAAYLWWSGRIADAFGDPPDSGDDTVDISIDGGAVQTITATDTFYADAAQGFVHYNYWYDLTGQIGTGTTTVALDSFDLLFDQNLNNRHYGFGVAVVYEDPTVPEATLTIQDGNDRGYWNWPPPAGPDSAVHCVPVQASPVSQTFDITLNITGVDSNEGVLRPQTLWWLAGSGAQPAGDDANASGIKAGTGIVNPVDPGPAFTDPYGFVWFTFTVTAQPGDEWVCTQLESVDDDPVAIGATTGMGVLEYLVPTLHRLGNLVWIDANGNGLADIGEPGIEGVTVELFDENDVLIATTTTDADGKYEFAGLPAGNYYVNIPAGQDGAGGPLEGLTSSTIEESDPNTDADNDDNGLVNGADITSGIVTVGDVEGPDLSDDASNEPDDEVLRSGDGTDDDPDDTVYEDVRSNFSVDFGFLGEIPEQASIGNLVWNDLNDNGVVDAGEPVFEGITVNLWTADADGNPVDLVQTTVTDADGHYGFLVDPGDYIIQIPPEMFAPGGPLEGFVSSTPTFDPTDGTDNDDNGDDNPDLGVVTAPVTVDFGTAPIGEADDDPFGVIDENSNLTIDLGLVQPTVLAGIGNYVWFDERIPATDAEGNVVGGPGNNTQDTAEPGIAGVQVRLYDENNAVVGEMVTDEDGFYLFLGLEPGDYWVEFEWDPTTQIDPADLANPEFYDQTTPLILTTPDAGEDDAIDSDGEGVKEADGQPTRIARTIMTTLDPGEIDLTWDLGLTRGIQVLDEAVGIGNLVWFDKNQDGVWNDGERVIEGVVMEAWIADADGERLSLLETTVTDENGEYYFGINQSVINVIIRVAPSNFLVGGALTDDNDVPYGSTKTGGGDNQRDHDDNGLDGTDVRDSGVESVVIILDDNTEPQSEDGIAPTGGVWDLIDDDDDDFTVDFGFVEMMVPTGHGSEQQAGYALMLLGFGLLMVMGVDDWTRKRLQIA